MTKVKICGITNIQDGLAAAIAGADYLGFILWEHSPRAVSAEKVHQICQELRQLENCPVLVGVFVNQTGDEVARLLDYCGLDVAQLHGEELPALIGSPHSPIYQRAYKALRPMTLLEAQAEAEWYLPPEQNPCFPSLLLDSYHPSLRGGSGQTGNWQLAAQLAATIPGLILAGGLTPENVAEAVRQVQPFAVDVASGVEKSAGIKNHHRLQTFIQIIQEQKP